VAEQGGDDVLPGGVAPASGRVQQPVDGVDDDEDGVLLHQLGQLRQERGQPGGVGDVVGQVQAGQLGVEGGGKGGDPAGEQAGGGCPVPGAVNAPIVRFVEW
jgi:hypothetical protein